MKTAVRATSVQAYHEALADGTLAERQRQILAVMVPGRDYSLQELVSLTGIPVNVISGRVNELKNDLGRLEHGHTRRCTVTGRTIHPVKLVARQESLLELVA